MSKAAETMQSVDERFDEKDFYLDEFRAHTLAFALTLEDCEKTGGYAALGEVLHDLLANDTRVIVLLGLAPGQEAESSLQRVRRRLQPSVLAEQTLPLFPTTRGRPSTVDSFIDVTAAGVPGDESDAILERIWEVLRRQPLLVGVLPEESLLSFAQQLAVRLKVQKLVMVDPHGGIATSQGGQMSFMDEAVLQAILQTGEAEWAGVAGRCDTLRAVQAALRGGVGAVNLCSLAGLRRELFTYEGSGTLFTLEDYCRIERLGIDEFEEVTRLIERGQREGYLRLRSPEEITRILLNGYGATIGAHHLAGVCALEEQPYRTERAGEIACLYTITRFKGERVGVRLVERALADARALGLRYVFACTTQERAAAFFQRVGFRPAAAGDVPPAKWRAYDPRRRNDLRIFRIEIEPPASPKAK